LIRSRFGEAARTLSRKDPRIKDDESVRAPLQMLTNALNLWKQDTSVIFSMRRSLERACYRQNRLALSNSYPSSRNDDPGASPIPQKGVCRIAQNRLRGDNFAH
jgi:hypothetical protein